MINIEEFREITDSKLMELTDYIHNADISYLERKKRTLELAITIFMTSINMNSEKDAKNDVLYHISLLMKAADDTIKLQFHGKKPESCESINFAKSYEEHVNDR